MNQAPVPPQQVDVLWEIIAADHVKDDVDARIRRGAGPLPRARDPVLLAIVQGALAAQFAQEPAFVLRAGGRSYMSAKSQGRLDRHGADAAGAALHEEMLAFEQPSRVKQVRPH